MPRVDRRTILRAMGSAALGAAFPASILRAMAIEPKIVTGTIKDVKHIVVLMQENRSFDHYLGTLRGVRGFSDPRPLTLPGGASVFHHPRASGSPHGVTPFHMDTALTRGQSLPDLDHSWKASHRRWRWHDAWVPTKTPLTMGH